MNLTRLDRLALALFPRWGLRRVRARAVASTLARHYEAAASGRRTTNWNKSAGDANAASGSSLSTLRALARDLVRNNGWARSALQVIQDNTVGWGIQPTAVGPESGAAAAAWESWASTTACDSEGRLTFDGIQSLAMRTIAESGEVLIRRRRRQPAEGGLPLQLQLLEPDYLDSSQDFQASQSGGPIVQGVEFDSQGRRTAYWLFDQHPGSTTSFSYKSSRVPASDVLHVFLPERPGQVRGVSWLAAAIVAFREFHEFEDAQLVRQKVAACFAAFVTDIDGTGTAISEQDEDDDLVETLEPGQIQYLRPGQQIAFGNPPLTTDDGFSARTLRKIASALGVTYQDLTGDFSQFNFSSARMARLKHWASVNDWRWLMFVPQLCDPVWRWAMGAALDMGLLREVPGATWTAQPMPMTEPDREGLAFARLVRTGAMTPDEMVRQQGYDPARHWAEYQANLEELDRRGIVLDCDPRKTSQAGLTQARAGQTSGEYAPPPEETPPPS